MMRSLTQRRRGAEYAENIIHCAQMRADLKDDAHDIEECCLSCFPL